ncbi:polynucleotide adenylyltransferase family protein [Wolffia australiana]
MRLLSINSSTFSYSSLSLLLRRSSPPRRRLAASVFHRRRHLCVLRELLASATRPFEKLPAGSMGAARVAVKSSIDLTEKEDKIFQQLIGVVHHFQMETQLRVAGGWVRDKLLGLECFDIDIALDNMLGREFCDKVNEYLSLRGEERRGVGVIQCNPDQSKHLETARMRIYDVWIDFVNLRSETYAEHSRIPSMIFGTAEEDAYRRDLTINSLFYNINTNSVEDLTGKGIADLMSGIINTPLPPMSTFLDDPLRVLRAIRFGSRFGFTLDDDVKTAAAHEEVKSAIASKVSRERIGREVDLMMSDRYPVKAVTYLNDLQLFWVVFSLPNNLEPAIPKEVESLCVEYMTAAWNLLQSLGGASLDVDHRRLFLYAALFLPLRTLTFKDKKGKELPVTSHIFRSSLKLKASDGDTVANVHGVLAEFISLIDFLNSDETPDPSTAHLGDDYLDDLPLASKRRIVAGMILRQIKDFWPVALLLSTLIYPRANHADDFRARDFEVEDAAKIYASVHEILSQELALDKVWELKPLVKGDEIMDILRLKTGGPQIREWQNRLLKWQLAHPEAEKEAAVAWVDDLRSKRAKIC